VERWLLEAAARPSLRPAAAGFPLYWPGALLLARAAMELLAQLACDSELALGLAPPDLLSAAQRRKLRQQKLAAKRQLVSKRGGETRHQLVKQEESDGTSSEDGESSEEAKASGSANSGATEQKKQMRMIRNRQSAALSRKRKADRISALEQRVIELETENMQLRRRLQGTSLSQSELAALVTAVKSQCARIE